MARNTILASQKNEVKSKNQVFDALGAFFDQHGKGWTGWPTGVAQGVYIARTRGVSGSLNLFLILSFLQIAIKNLMKGNSVRKVYHFGLVRIEYLFLLQSYFCL